MVVVGGRSFNICGHLAKGNEDVGLINGDLMSITLDMVLPVNISTYILHRRPRFS